MSTREPIYIEKEEMEKQKAYIEKARAFTQNFKTAHGHAPLAVVTTYGCQQNQNDSEKIKGILKEIGYDFTEDLQIADLILYNTCAVRENAELKVFGNVGALTHLKKRKPSLQIALCGCMMQQPHIVADIKRKYRHVDMVFGTHTLYRFGEILYKSLKNNQRIFDVIDIEGKIAEDVPVKRDSTHTAWVSIMYGCNNFCTYCIVPYVRGRERSRLPQNIIAEVRALVSEGVKDITLLGQNVNSYGRDLQENIDFPDLLKQVNDVEGDFRIRFMTSHPKDAGRKLFETMARCKKVTNHLHLPFQSGNNKVLRAMNRHYTKEDYLSLIAIAKELNPNIVLTSDIIVGFPQESYEEFCDTVDMIKQVEFDSLYTFIYSKRVGTPAATMEGQIEDVEKHKRFDELLEAQKGISRAHNEALVGRTLRVLVEGTSKNNQDAMTGRTDGNRAVNFAGTQDKIGTFVNVKITEANTWSLFGTILD